MSTVFTWSIDSLERSQPENIVVTISYSVTADDGTFCEKINASIDVTGLHDTDPFIPYDQLTDEICLDWVKVALVGSENVASLEQSLQAIIDERHHPSRVLGKPF